MTMKVILYFGSFNPIHKAHVAVAQSALLESRADELWFVVSPKSPFKVNDEMLDEQHRLQMVSLAIQKHSKMKASDVEFSMPIPSYTIDTLLHLSQVFSNYEFSILMGEDNVVNIHKWKSGDLIVENFPIYYYPRSGSNYHHPHSNIRRIDCEQIDMSSSKIRSKISDHLNLVDYLDDAVCQYIKEQKIYEKN